MKKITIYMLTLSLCFKVFSQHISPAPAPSSGADDTLKKDKKHGLYFASIKTMDNEKLKKWLYKLDDNSIYLQPSSKRQIQDIGKRNLSFQAEQINTISVQRKNSGLKGALIGLGIGAASGVIIGFVSGDDSVTPYTGDFFTDFAIGVGNSFAMTAEEKALEGGIVLGVTGTITGFLIGKLVKKKFFISGKKENFMNARGELMQRSLSH